jgi:glyoxylase-like metal-dependent hydrolase (beta-lactamase superfamily II)
MITPFAPLNSRDLSPRFARLARCAKEQRAHNSRIGRHNERGRRALMLALAALLSVSAVTAQQTLGGTARDALTVTRVQGNVYMISGAGPNVTVQIGRYGPVLVDTPTPSLVPQVLAEIRKLSPRPVRLLLHTTADADYVAGDAALMATTAVPEAMIHNNLYNRLLASTSGSLPLPASTITYSERMVDNFNSEAIVVYQVDPAVTDSDSIVFFRGSDVISTGGIYTPGRYPVVDIERGGTIDGLIEAVYKVLELAVPDNLGEGGTAIVPGRGRLAEESDLGEYRNMLVIVTERIRDLRTKGMTLEQVKASGPSRDYDTEYHATKADADRFVESVYRTLPQPPKPAARGARAAGRGRS